MPLKARIKTYLAVAVGASVPIGSIAFALCDNSHPELRAAIVILSILLMAQEAYFLYLLTPGWDGWLSRMRSFHRGERIAALTFDDGPDAAWTPKVLDILRDEGVRATFFALGAKASDNPDIVRRIVDEGHDLGNHTTAHRKILCRQGAESIEDIEGTNEILHRISGKRPTIFRAPHGFKAPRFARRLERLGLKQIPWTKGIWDTDGSDASALLARFRRRFDDLEILLLHDGGGASLTSSDRSATVSALPQIIEEYRNSRYAFKRITELGAR